VASYCEIGDVRLVLNPRALANSTTTIVSDTVISTAISRSSDELDGYLDAQYSLPLVSWGDDVRYHVADAAAFRCMQFRGYNPEGGDSIFRAGYDDFREWARLISRGMLSPPSIVDQTTARDGGPLVVSDGGGVVVGAGVEPSSTTSTTYAASMPVIQGDDSDYAAGGSRGW
jgi:phage gp36-like protein